MGKRHEAIGIKQVIHFEWVKKTANLLLSGVDTKTIRQELHDFIADKKGNGSSGKRSDQTRTFVVNNLMKIWVTPDSDLIPFRDAALGFLRQNPSMALAVHWAVISAVYPFWFNVAKQIGRLLGLQEEVTQKQIINRMKEQYGDRETVSRYSRYVIRSFINWGVLEDAKSGGVYRYGHHTNIGDNTELIGLIIEGLLHQHAEGRMHVDALLRSPGLFPFSLPHCSIENVISKNDRVEIEKTGFELLMIHLVK
ncbi:MAG: hypothetical protein HQ515_06825 [Phycisphaeraceae bacterium]|nr:hypothetical protein [Phycisphaeraceae bacterium]